MTDNETMKALAAYSGKVTRYPPGKARGDKPIKPKAGCDGAAASWQVPPPDQDKQRRRRRIERARRQRIAKRNAMIRKGMVR